MTKKGEGLGTMRHPWTYAFFSALVGVGLIISSVVPLFGVSADPDPITPPTQTIPATNDSISNDPIDILTPVVANGTLTDNENAAAPRLATVSKAQYFYNLQTSKEYSQAFVDTFKKRMKDIARSNVLEGNWLVPGIFYPQTFSRDSFWMLLALQDPTVTKATIERFRDDQTNNSDGHIATALYRNGSMPIDRDRNEESTMMYVLSNLVYQRQGGTPDKESLLSAYTFMLGHVTNGKYYTAGETRFFDSNGGYHYWADTLKMPTTVVAYNQGLFVVSLRALVEMGISVDPILLQQAQTAYRNMVNPADNATLPLMEGSTITDVSALSGEALSLLLFDEPILDHPRVAATIDHLFKYDAVRYPDGRFLGFKIIADYFGGYRPSSEFLLPGLNTPGNYQNGGSWFLYDMLALYASARHGVAGSTDLMIQRMQSEFRFSNASHEFINTNPATLGHFETNRDDYGWNTAVINLLP
jgi:hypothetical protein